jgi:hypothetical protein
MFERKSRNQLLLKTSYTTTCAFERKRGISQEIWDRWLEDPVFQVDGLVDLRYASAAQTLIRRCIRYDLTSKNKKELGCAMLLQSKRNQRLISHRNQRKA